MFDILLVDDSRIFLASIRGALSGMHGVNVVGVAHNGKEALDLAEHLHPHLILMDIAMPVLNGLDACKQVVRWKQPPVVIFLSTHDGAEYCRAAIDVGGQCLVSKSNIVHELLPMIEGMVKNAGTSTGALHG
jgi:DNA-binding NarL/FixJ family response regulator